MTKYAAFSQVRQLFLQYHHPGTQPSRTFAFGGNACLPFVRVRRKNVVDRYVVGCHAQGLEHTWAGPSWEAALEKAKAAIARSE